MNKLGQSFTYLLGAIFIVVGALGFVLPSPLLGLFEVDAVHNIIHLLSGALALAAASAGVQMARMYLMVFGLVYAIVTVVGMSMGGDILGIFHVNMFDNYLHAGISALCLGMAFNMTSKKS